VSEVIPVLHNVSSVQKVVDTAKLVYGLEFKTLVITKAYGGAAQNGIAEAMKIALKQDKQLLVLPELSDAVELLKPEQVILLSFDYSKERMAPEEIPVKGRTLLVTSGSDPDFSASELKLGVPVYIEGVRRKLGSIAELAIILYALRRVGVRDG
jgi:SpoU rRNA methylase family enzyme